MTDKKNWYNLGENLLLKKIFTINLGKKSYALHNVNSLASELDIYPPLEVI